MKGKDLAVKTIVGNLSLSLQELIFTMAHIPTEVCRYTYISSRSKYTGRKWVRYGMSHLSNALIWGLILGPQQLEEHPPLFVHSGIELQIDVNTR